MQQFFKSYLPSAWSDLVLRRSLGNLLNELLIIQKSLINRLVVTLLVTYALYYRERYRFDSGAADADAGT